MATSVGTFRYVLTPDDPVIVRRMVAATGFFSTDEVNVAVELVDERLQKGDGSGYHFVFLERNGQTLGYTCYGPIACTVGSYDLFWIVVDPTFQRQGAGNALLLETERLILEHGGRHIYIETSNRPQYEPTRYFYQRCDYEQAAVLDDFYDQRDDKVIYRKRLIR